MPQPSGPLPSLENLQSRIDAASPLLIKDDGPPAAQGLSLAMRMGVELVAGVLVGAGAGYALDRAIGTLPLFLILCFFLGCGAGFLNMKRAVEQLDKEDESGTTPRASNEK